MAVVERETFMKQFIAMLERRVLPQLPAVDFEDSFLDTTYEMIDQMRTGKSSSIE